MAYRPFYDPAIDPPDPQPVPIAVVATDAVAPWQDRQPEPRQRWLVAAGFRGEAGQHAWWPGDDGVPAGAVVALSPDNLADLAALPSALPDRVYRLDLSGWGAAGDPAWLAETLARAWAKGAYQFTRYTSAGRSPARLVMPDGVNAARVSTIAGALALGRDLINTPANDMGPSALAAAATDLAGRHGADCTVVVGPALLDRNFPLIHAVGRASADAPRLIDITWGDPLAPKLTVLGKGVCFDTGGLDLKPAGNMLLMKKDMGGAAHALALADMIMGLDLPVRLRVLIPAVENAVSGNAFRPMDVLASRKGLTVEIGNTDAEGRLVLADALTLAMDDAPDLVIDFATLTGAARVALGADLPAMFTNRNDLAAAFETAGQAAADPVWRLPLHAPYAKLLKSRVADLSNTGETPFAGAIMAALFLQRFVDPSVAWAHFDVYGWSQSDRPGKPRGAAIMAVEAALGVIEQRYAAAPTP